MRYTSEACISVHSLTEKPCTYLIKTYLIQVSEILETQVQGIKKAQEKNTAIK